ncbi:unnamed protein product, partial [Amoebophrya sp. A120]|eukprot:GSA120T00007054001.1
MAGVPPKTGFTFGISAAQWDEEFAPTRNLQHNGTNSTGSFSQLPQNPGHAKQTAATGTAARPTFRFNPNSRTGGKDVQSNRQVAAPPTQLPSPPQRNHGQDGFLPGGQTMNQVPLAQGPRMKYQKTTMTGTGSGGTTVGGQSNSYRGRPTNTNGATTRAGQETINHENTRHIPVVNRDGVPRDPKHWRAYAVHDLMQEKLHGFATANYGATTGSSHRPQKMNQNNPPLAAHDPEQRAQQMGKKFFHFLGTNNYENSSVRKADKFRKWTYLDVGGGGDGTGGGEGARKTSSGGHR